MAKKQFSFWQEVGCFGLFKLVFLEHHVIDSVYRIQTDGLCTCAVSATVERGAFPLLPAAPHCCPG